MQVEGNSFWPPGPYSSVGRRQWLEGSEQGSVEAEKDESSCMVGGGSLEALGLEPQRKAYNNVLFSSLLCGKPPFFP